MASRLLNGNAAASTVLEPFDIVGDYWRFHWDEVQRFYDYTVDAILRAGQRPILEAWSRPIAPGVTVVSLIYRSGTSGTLAQWDGGAYQSLGPLPATLDDEGTQRWMRASFELDPMGDVEEMKLDVPNDDLWFHELEMIRRR